MPDPSHAAMVSSVDEVYSGDKILTEKEMQEFRRKNIVAALEASDWRVSGPNGAASLLGVRPTTLADRVKSLGIRKPRRN